MEEKINPPLIWRFLDHLTCKIPFKIIRFRTTNIYLNTIVSGTITDTLQLGLEEASQILREWEYKGIISIKGYDGANIKNFASPWLITINDVEFFK